MSKKKHPEHVNHERWLVSYADFITLLFAFFVVLFASGQNDKRKTVKLAQAMQSAFQYNGIFDQHAKTPPLTDDPATAPAATPSPLMLPVPSAVEQEKLTVEIMQHIQEHFQHELGLSPAFTPIKSAPSDKFGNAKVQAALPVDRRPNLSSITVHRTADGIVVSLREAGFFNSGSADVRDESLGLVRAVAESLPHQPMRVEGHTDDIPIHTAQFATNWELSTARAATITRMLLALHAADPNQISASGYAEFQPMAPNSTADGRSQNRRVDIVLLAPTRP